MWATTNAENVKYFLTLVWCAADLCGACFKRDCFHQDMKKEIIIVRRWRVTGGGDDDGKNDYDDIYDTFNDYNDCVF